VVRAGPPVTPSCRRRHLGKEPAALPGRRPSGYRDSSSSVRRRWFFPKIAIRTPGRTAHGIVTNTKKGPGLATVKSAPAISTPPQAPRCPTPSVQPVPSERNRVGLEPGGVFQKGRRWSRCRPAIRYEATVHIAAINEWRPSAVSPGC